MKRLIVKGAREHNLKNIDVSIPRNALVVVSGLSGSGKSSLAFDTIYAEGQRRYVESLSPYARQFLGRMEKPELDYIEGLSPAIAIEQKTTHRNPRSTVGTVTEIYDYLRLLYARIGHAYCPNGHGLIEEQSIDQIVDSALSMPDGSRLAILAPLLRERKTTGQKIISDANSSGFKRLRINGAIVNIDEEEIKLDKKRKHSIDIVVDRIILNKNNRKRLADSIETSLEVADGKVLLCKMNQDNKILEEQLFSEHNSCKDCGFSMPELQPRLFSFNNPIGACPDCDGLGINLEFDFELICPDSSLSLAKNALLPYKISTSSWSRSTFSSLAKHFNFSLDTPYEELTPKLKDVILNGHEDIIQFEHSNDKGSNYKYRDRFKGILSDLNRRYRESDSNHVRAWLESFMSKRNCSTCKGRRLRDSALSVLVNGLDIHTATCMTVTLASDFFRALALNEAEQHIAEQILKEINDRIGFLQSVGLGYLSLQREAATLSGGEAQRIRLATQIGSSLTGVLYILDEPSIGLHQRDNQRLIDTLLHLRNLDNTVIVVEHDEQTLKTADYIVDVGPRAGVHGGEIVASGTPREVMQVTESLTGQYLRGKLSIDTPLERRGGTGKQIKISGATEHNLKNISLSIPLGVMNLITGVSGSGKSTLLNSILYPAAHNAVERGKKLPVGSCKKISGLENIDKVIAIDQSAIGRTPRSNPATYVGFFTAIRELFAGLAEAKVRGFKAGRFSFNVKGGRCESCEGGGTKKIEMHFLPDVYVTCDICAGKRFNSETLEIRYKGKNIHDVLEMTVEEAEQFFAAIPSIHRKLDMIMKVGLGYITLGQSALTLSGGEAQRVKLALELSKRGGERSLYVIDEPTTGLHFVDVKLLLEVLHNLVDKGSTICMIEHNLDVIKQADYIIDLGPDGGTGGGRIMATGSPEELAKCRESYTGQFLNDILS